MALVLGVTGSIATGKSYLCQYLVENYGAIHADADKGVHRMYDPGKPGFDRIVTEFGDSVVGDDGYIDRKILGSKVFGDQERMNALTKAIGDIAAEMKSIIDEWRETCTTEAIAILEAVNLIEAGYSKWCDATWLVAAEDDVALPRLMERNGFSEEEAKQRLASQRNWKDRAPASDLIFHNNSATANFTSNIDEKISETGELLKANCLPVSRWFAWHDQQQ